MAGAGSGGEPPSTRMTMHDIPWLDLFSSIDRFLLAMVHHYGSAAYVALFLIVFSETGLVFMAFLPGDSLLFIAGAIAASGSLQAGILVATIASGAMIGNTVNYWIGAWLGHKIYDGTIRWIDKAALQRTHDFYERHGGKTIVAARFIPVVRSFAPLVAGASRMDLGKFRLFNIVGALLWSVLLVGGGYLFGNVPVVRDHLGLVLIIGLCGALGPVVLVSLWRALVSGRRTAAPADAGRSPD
jgi:membrane-associated protein